MSTPGLEILAPDSAPFFVYQLNAVPADEAQDLVEFLATVPERDEGETDASSEFFFQRHPGRDGDAGRAEAAAGDPIWLGTDWGRGVDIPPAPLFLHDRVGLKAKEVGFERLLGFTPNLSFTSTYVDRYLPGGGFFPHTDGDRYGEVIAGASIGPGSASFALWSGDDDHASPEVEFTVAPNSIYFLCGPIRRSPWRHAIRQVTDLRYGITWRTTSGS